MSQNAIHQKRMFYIHLSFWGIYFSFFLYQITFMRRDEDNFVRPLIDAIIQTLVLSFISYLNYFIWLPRFLKHRSIVRYFAEFILPFALIIFCHIAFKQWLYNYEGTPERMKWFLNSSKFYTQHTVTSLFTVIFVGMLRFLENWFELEAQKKEIENEKLMAELRFLKAQINPHFLFNTLNNLYYLATVNSPNTTEVIEKLSQMMRYMLYDSNHAKVPLKKEIEYMQNYISLEKLRLDNQIPIKFEIVGNVDSVQIVPLIFITFLENAFKHGVSNSFKEAFVNISIKIEQNECMYKVENRKLPKDNLIEKSGIGLQNVKRRLDLSYPDKYELTKTETDTEYKIVLKIMSE